jgi:hypothetical protein
MMVRKMKFMVRHTRCDLTLFVGDTWTMIEVFQKGNTNDTCLLDRGVDIDRRKDAMKYVNKTILHTKRQVWEYTVRPGYCFDTGNVKYGLVKVILISSVICFALSTFHRCILECEKDSNSLEEVWTISERSGTFQCQPSQRLVKQNRNYCSA